MSPLASVPLANMSESASAAGVCCRGGTDLRRTAARWPTPPSRSSGFSARPIRPSSRGAAIRVLGELGGKDPAVARAVAAALDDADPAVRLQAPARRRQAPHRGGPPQADRAHQRRRTRIRGRRRRGRRPGSQGDQAAARSHGPHVARASPPHRRGTRRCWHRQRRDCRRRFASRYRPRRRGCRHPFAHRQDPVAQCRASAVDHRSHGGIVEAEEECSARAGVGSGFGATAGAAGRQARRSRLLGPAGGELAGRNSRRRAQRAGHAAASIEPGQGETPAGPVPPTPIFAWRRRADAPQECRKSATRSSRTGCRCSTARTRRRGISPWRNSATAIAPKSPRRSSASSGTRMQHCAPPRWSVWRSWRAAG